MKNLELRMYGFVPYQLMGIQSGIQFGHAVIEYSRMVLDMPGLEEQYNEWADKWKTFIVLNGGNTNDSEDYKGTMQLHRDALKENSIPYAEFRELDLGNQLLGVCFLCDERVFNYKKYPDYKFIFSDKKTAKAFKEENINVTDFNNIKWFLLEHNEDFVLNNYMNWVEQIGGNKNLFLRGFTKNFKLAT